MIDFIIFKSVLKFILLVLYFTFLSFIYLSTIKITHDYFLGRISFDQLKISWDSWSFKIYIKSH